MILLCLWEMILRKFFLCLSFKSLEQTLISTSKRNLSFSLRILSFSLKYRRLPRLYSSDRPTKKSSVLMGSFVALRSLIKAMGRKYAQNMGLFLDLNLPKRFSTNQFIISPSYSRIPATLWGFMFCLQFFFFGVVSRVDFSS